MSSEKYNGIPEGVKPIVWLNAKWNEVSNDSYTAQTRNYPSGEVALVITFPFEEITGKFLKVEVNVQGEVRSFSFRFIREIEIIFTDSKDIDFLKSIDRNFTILKNLSISIA